ncbi:YDG domain-containing protein [Janthinobacterium sp. PAMC25594]|uniref:YDG domain-containing protein n=2 Tax=unclassified Janthinobacterium TaxID=2610881 RepID=UPI001C6328DB|nr:YDG domain-containing protein [Janthinobacterium sp. PAMC25594]QYG07296.1 filamentous hemagglutinin N-terminal domain-containing protein [Janthinobacterium sp. PAMC25594]
MNRIYRSIWNQATGAYAAVSENVKSAGKRSMPGCSGGGAHFALTSMAAALMMGYGSLALAGPAGGTVVAGQATINGAPGATVIRQGSQNAVINWASFNVGKGESVQFQQPNSNAVALNRVLGSDGTTILGNLSANGKVFIVNPNGVLFGQGASVNTAGLVASTLDISNSDFMAGKYQFSGNGTGKVLNQGSISAPGGYVALLGANVSNEGTIQARLGSVALAAGRAITLDVAGDGLLNVAVNAGAVGALVNNGGMIRADGGSVVLTAQAAGDLLRTVVNNTGVIEAQTIATRGGTIKLLGDMQTGTVNAGGTLDASAPVSGKGGFIDTSAAHVKLDDALKVTTASSHGLTGTWLIDPSDYTIAATGGDQTGAFFTNALKSSSVQIQSISGGSGVLGDINVNDTISWSANQLKLTAQNNININQPLRGSGTASLALEYGQANVASGNTSKYNVKAEIDLPSGLNFSTKLGSDTVTATTYTVINSLGAATSTSGTDLQGLKNALSGYFVLGANIDASGTSSTAVWGANGFTPIGTTATPFTGQFDGLGHVVTGLTSSTTASAGLAGLFGSNSGSLRNIGLVAPVISANIVAAQGNIAGLAGINSGTISNAYVSGGSVTVTTGAIGAGLVGLNSGTISDSYNSSKVSVVGNYDFWLGGLVGNTTKTSSITNSYNAGDVVGAYTAGGLTGNNLGIISNSFNSGNVSGTSNTGGLTSYNRATGVITNSFNTGTVTGKSLTGGLVGSNVASSQIINSYSTGAVSSVGLVATGIGGLVGGNSGIIKNSYATGTVTGVTAVGGVVGTNTSAGSIVNVYSSGAVSLLPGGSGVLGGVLGSIAAGTSPVITGGYYNTTVNSGIAGVGNNGGPSTPSLTGLTSTQMQTASNFSAFTFTTTTGATGNNWVMVNTDGSLNGAGNATGATGPMLAAEYSSNIYSSHQLQLMAMNLAGNYTLKQDINAAGTGTAGDVWNGATFVPVGTGASSPFSGSLDGAGHTISGLVVNRPSTDFSGLFGYISNGASVRNVGLEGGSITGRDYTGALVGANQGGTVSGNFSTVNVTGNNFVGGLVGNSTGTINNNYASGAVTGVDGVGGLLGSNVGSVINNYSTGQVTGSTNTGGLLGYNFGSGSSNFWDATTSGIATSATGTGLSTAQMKLLATYSGASWDLSGAWIVYDTNTYPLLRAFMTPLQVTFASNASKTYDGTNSWAAPGYTYSNPNVSLSGTLNYGAAGSAVNAGTYAITAGGLYSGQHGYAISSNPTTLTIDKRAATLSGATVVSRDYDGTTAATLSGGSLSGVLLQDSGNLTFNTGAFDTKDAGTGKAVTAISTGSAGGNYIVTANGLTGTITPKALTLSGLAATTRQYDGGTTATLTGGTLNGLIGSETLSLGATGGVFDGKNAGTQAVTLTLGTLSDGSGLASNYTVTAPTNVTGTITAKTLTWTNLAVDNKEYDGNATAAINKGSITGLVSGETLTAGPTAAFADQNAGNGKTVTVSTLLGNGGGGGLASNYTLANTSVTANITPKALTMTGATAGNKEYDGTTAAVIAGGTLIGLVGKETLTLGTLSGTFGDKNAGTNKAVTVTGGSLSDGGNGGLASNYSVGAVTGLSANITQKALTVSGVTVASKVYDGDTKATISGGTLNGLVIGETLSLSGQSGAFNDQNAGNGKAVTLTGASLGDGTGLASNYTVSNATDATGNITPKALTVTGASAVTRVYDGTTAATLAGGVLDGLVSGETLTLSGLSGAYATKTAGSGKAVTVTGATLADNTGGLASNYTVSNPTSVTGNVTKASISSVSGLSASDKTYDGSTAAVIGGKAVITGMVVGDDLAFSSASGAFSDQNAGTGKTVNISGITLTGNDLANYNFTNTSATATASIARKALTVIGATAANRVYDGSTVAAISGGSLDGLVGKETLTLTSMTGLFADKNVGTAKAVTVSGAALTGGANGGLASNYTVTDATGLTANITKATISTVSNIVADSKVYDANTKATVSATGATFNGMVGGDSLSLSATNAAFADKNAGVAKTVAVTGIALGGTDAANYNLSSTTGSGSGAITPKAVTITGMTAVNKVYDGSTKASVSGGAISGTVGAETLGATGLVARFSDKDVGSGKTVTSSGTTLVNGNNGGLASNYTVTNPTFTANITPKALTVTGMTAGTRVYDGTTAATLSGGALSGLVSGETLLVSGGTGVFADKNAGNGKTVTVSGVGIADGTGLASNYTVSNPGNVTGNIIQKALTISGMSASGKVYDGTVDAVLSGGTLQGLVNDETIAITGKTGVFTDKNAGLGKDVRVQSLELTNGTGLASNYSVSVPMDMKADIAQKALVVGNVTALDKTYDGTAGASFTGGTLSGFVKDETVGLGSLAGKFADQNAGSGKDVSITGGTLSDGANGGLASNYIVASSAGLKASISQKSLTVSGVTAGNKTYDGSDKASLTGGVLNGLVGTETLTLSGQSGAFSDKNAGLGKDVTVSGATLGNAGSGATAGLASNYTVSNATGVKADIAQKQLTVGGIAADNKVYDGGTVAALDTGSATFGGLVTGDSLNASASGAFSDKNAAAGKTVNISGIVLGGVDAGNYTLDSTTATATADITAKALTVTGQLAGNKVYDGNAQASLSGGTLSGLVGSETLGIAGQTAVFSDKNAATAKAVTVTGTTLVDTASGLASNYTVGNPTGLTASITAKALTVTGQQAGNKVYDGNTTAQLSSGVLAGLVAGESLGLAGQTASFADKNAANGKTVTVTGTTLVDTSTGLASNYTVSNPTGLTASITAKALTVSGQLAGNKVYDGNVQANLSGGTLNGLVGSETLGIAGQTAVFSDKNAATAKAVTVTGTTLVDTASGLASNYTVGNPTGLTASITAKALTVSGQLAGNKVYDGNAQASLSGGVLSGLVGSETLGLGGQTAVFSDKNAANGKTVTVKGTTLVDTSTGLASNYTVSNPTGLTASITAKALTVTGQLAGNKVYDGNAQASLSGGVLSGLVGSETLGIAGQTAVFSDKNAATAKAVTVTGTTLVDTASGLASNYTVSNPTGLTASITAKALTVTGQLAGNKVYDGNAQASLSGGVLSGLVGSETLGIAGQTAVFSDKNAATAKAVTVTGTTLVDTSTGLASNYTVSNPTGLTASITPASLMVRATGAVPRVYDTSTNASVTLSDNRIAGDVLTISNSGASFADKNAGANKTVTVNGIALSGTDAGNYTVNATATTTASITQAALGVKVGNAEKDQGFVNPAFTASYTGLLGNDTLANEVSGNLVFSTPASIATPSGSYLVSAAGQTSSNYALTYTPGVLTIKPTEARQGAVASVIAAVNVAPSQGNMVQAEVVAKGETVTSKEDAVQVALEGSQPRQGGSTPVVLTTASVNSNVLPGLRLSVVDTGLRLPVAAGNTSIESQ